MKMIIKAILIATVVLATGAQATVVPAPIAMESRDGLFTLNAQTRILFTGDAAKHEAEMVASWLRPASGLPLHVKHLPALRGEIGNAIWLKLGPPRGSGSSYDRRRRWSSADRVIREPSLIAAM